MLFNGARKITGTVVYGFPHVTQWMEDRKIRCLLELLQTIIGFFVLKGHTLVLQIMFWWKMERFSRLAEIDLCTSPSL